MDTYSISPTKSSMYIDNYTLMGDMIHVDVKIGSGGLGTDDIV